MTATSPISSEKFQHPNVTADGSKRAIVTLSSLDTLWINTGTLCNLTCRNCYIESSPTNDSLVYISANEVSAFLDEISGNELSTREIGFTGGEPFMNPDFPVMLETTLERGYKALVLTNAMKPMMKMASALQEVHSRYAGQLTMRVSLDHYSREGHQTERGPRTWQPALDGLSWLNERGFNLNIAGRTFTGENERTARKGYADLFARLGLSVNADNPSELILFPEMDATLDVPEITTACWGILDINPNSLMCASSRMVVKRKGNSAPTVVACTLLPYDKQFEFGETLASAHKTVSLNHPHCARFCVLGGASCS